MWADNHLKFVSSIPCPGSKSGEKGKKWLMQDILKAWTTEWEQFMAVIQVRYYRKVTKHHKRHRKRAGEYIGRNVVSIATKLNIQDTR